MNHSKTQPQKLAHKVRITQDIQGDQLHVLQAMWNHLTPFPCSGVSTRA